MEIKDVESRLDQADSFLTKLKLILKKHWGILTLMGIAYFIYWSLTTDLPEEKIPAITREAEPNKMELPIVIEDFMEEPIDTQNTEVIIIRRPIVRAPRNIVEAIDSTVSEEVFIPDTIFIDSVSVDTMTADLSQPIDTIFTDTIADTGVIIDSIDVIEAIDTTIIDTVSEF